MPLWSIHADRVKLTVKARPAAKGNRPFRIVDVGDQQRAIEISVAAAAQEGKANKAIEAKIAKALGLKSQQVGIVTGQTSRLKVVELAGDPAQLAAKVEAWIKEIGE